VTASGNSGLRPAKRASGRGRAVKFAIRRVGVVGLGRMGHAFTTNLIADGYHVLVHDRDPKRVANLVAEGAHRAAVLKDLAICDVVLTSLQDDDTLAEIALPPGGLASFMKVNAVHISMSTVSPVLSGRIAEEHATRGQDYVAAPVLGNVEFARIRQLFILAAGAPSVLAKVRSLLDRLGHRLFVIGEDATMANLFKLAAIALTATTLDCMVEVLALLRQAGMNSQHSFEVLTNTLFDSRVHRNYGLKMVEADHSPPGMAIPLAINDLRLALAEAGREAVPMPAVNLVHDRLVAMAARGWTDLDRSALGLLAAIDASLDDHR